MVRSIHERKFGLHEPLHSLAVWIAPSINQFSTLHCIRFFGNSVSLTTPKLRAERQEVSHRANLANAKRQRQPQTKTNVCKKRNGNI